MLGCNSFTIKIIQMSCNFIFFICYCYMYNFYLLVFTPEALFFENFAF